MAAVAVAASLVEQPPSLAEPEHAAARRRPQPGYERCAGGFEVPRGAVHPWQLPAVPSREQMQRAPTFPVFVTPNPIVKTQVIDGTSDPQHGVPVNERPYAVNSAFFEGMMEVHLRGLPNTRPGMFEGKKRFFHIMMQGRFKHAVPAATLCMGQEFVKPGNAPPWVGELVFTAAAKVFSSSTQVDAYAELPYFMNPLLAACQLVNVSEPGQEPAMAEAHEDMRLFSPALADKNNAPLCAAKRRKWCDVPAHLQGLQLQPGLVYTFHIWQHLIDFSSYKLSVGSFVNVDLAAALNRQPLQLTLFETQSKQYLVSLLVWHERLLYGEHGDTSAAAAAAAAAVQQLGERLSSLGAGMLGLLGRQQHAAAAARA